MMKRMMAAVLALMMVFALVACGSANGGQESEAPDLQAYYDDFMASLGDNAPMMMAIEGDMLEAAYPGLSDYTLKQSVMQMAGISAVAFEMALVETETEPACVYLAHPQPDGTCTHEVASQEWQDAYMASRMAPVTLD